MFAHGSPWYSRLNFPCNRIAVVTLAIPGRPRRRGLGGSRDRSNRAARSFSLGSALNSLPWRRFSSLAKLAISLRTATGRGGVDRRRGFRLGCGLPWRRPVSAWIWPSSSAKRGGAPPKFSGNLGTRDVLILYHRQSSAALIASR